MVNHKKKGIILGNVGDCEARPVGIALMKHLLFFGQLSSVGTAGRIWILNQSCLLSRTEASPQSLLRRRWRIAPFRQLLVRNGWMESLSNVYRVARPSRLQDLS